MERRFIDSFYTFLSYFLLWGLKLTFPFLFLSVDWQSCLLLILISALLSSLAYEEGLEAGHREGYHEGYQIRYEIEKSIQLQSNEDT